MARRHLLWLLILFAACDNQGTPDTPETPAISTTETMVLSTDSADWFVDIFHTSLYYADAIERDIPSAYHIPTKAEAKILHDLTYPHNERFITSDGYTFGMPSATVSKAGQKTKYSVLGLRLKHTTIEMEW